MLELVAISSSRGSSQSRDGTLASRIERGEVGHMCSGRGGFRYALIGDFGIQEPEEGSLLVGILCDSLQEQV